MSESKLTVAIIGAGSRGRCCFANYIKNSFGNLAKVIAVAEPNKIRRDRIVEEHNIPIENVFHNWQDLLAKPRLADAVIIATQDKLHTAPAIAACEKGYNILLEKPMATTAQECIDIVKAVEKNGVILAVCHVLRYAPYYMKIKDIITSGLIGDVCTIEHLEGVGWWHQAHSYVRGNWRNIKLASPMLMAKSCHDIDLINWWVDRKCLKVSSFGGLKHFRRENAPDKATERCLDCPLADNKCPYSAKKFYFGLLERKISHWPLEVVIDEFSEKALEEALRIGPYGRCVYNCDNDVVDHQVVNIEFEGTVTASFTMTAFTPHGRRTRIMATHGYLEGDEQTLKVFDFNTEQWQQFNVNDLATDLSGGHGGGDQRLLKEFLNAVRNNDSSQLSTNARQTLQSHLIVFAAEKSRLSGRTVDMPEMGYTS